MNLKTSYDTNILFAVVFCLWYEFAFSTTFADFINTDIDFKCKDKVVIVYVMKA